MRLTTEFYTRSSVTLIAQELLGKVIFTRIGREMTAGLITETEAYAGITDRASHAYNNRRTHRTEVMYALGGVAYVYLCYGVHHLFNFVTNVKDVPDAVLLRGISPLIGKELMEHRTGKKFTKKGFTDGPGKTSNALGIKTCHNGESLMGPKIWVEDKGIMIKENDYSKQPRIGVGYAGEDELLPYRYVLNNDILQSIKKKAQHSAELF
jgi:DNA-3-methyladenine glycosylase